jgi:hypothetical protein
MPTNLFTFTELYSRVLGTLDHILVKAGDHAASIGVSEADMLEWRLIEDMNPLRFQAFVVINFTRQWPARVAGLPVPADIGSDLDLAGLRAAIAESKTHLAALKPEQFDGCDDTPMTVNLGQIEPTFPASQWLTVFATTNVYFHMSMAYGIARSKGVRIGKIDLFAGGL